MTDTPTPTPPADGPSDGETPPPEAPAQLPADHPLVKTLAEQKRAIKDLKSKAQRLDEIEEAKKTEAEKAADRIAKAEAEVATVPAKVADALRDHLVELHSIDKDDAELFLTGDNPELLLKQVTRLLGQAGKRKKQSNHVPREGASTQPPVDDEREAVRGLFGGG